MQLQRDKAAGVITEQQYKDAVVALEFRQQKKRKQVRKSKQTADDRKRRKAIRTLTKWIFDVEVFGKTTALYNNADQELKMQWPVFLQLADQVIDYGSRENAIVAAENRNCLYKTIEELVKNRRKNWRDSFKPRKDGKTK